MSATPELLAKSISHGGELSLLARTQHVVTAAEAVARQPGGGHGSIAICGGALRRQAQKLVAVAGPVAGGRPLCFGPLRPWWQRQPRRFNRTGWN